MLSTIFIRHALTALGVSKTIAEVFYFASIAMAQG